MAARCDAGASPGSAGGDGPRRPATAAFPPTVGWPAAASCPGRRARAATGHPGARRADREPDPGGAAEFFDRLAALRAERSTTIVLIEHLVEAAWPLADRHPRARRRRPPDRRRDARAESRADRRLGCATAGIWLPAAVERGDRGGPRVAAAWTTSGARRPPTRLSPSPSSRPPDLRFGFDRSEPVIRDVRVARSTPASGSPSSARTAAASRRSARLLVGLLRPDMGTVRLLGDDPADLSPAGWPSGRNTCSRIRSASSLPRPWRRKSCSACDSRCGPRRGC